MAACPGPTIENVGGSTLRGSVSVDVTLPEVAVIVRFLMPRGVELLETSVRTVLLSSVSTAGENEAVTPAGRPETET